MNEYICYDNRTDDILAIGNARECSKLLGYKSIDSFYSQLSAYENRNNPNYKSKRNVHIDIIKLEDNRNANQL